MVYLFPVIASNRGGDTVLLYSVSEVLAFVKGKFVGTHWFRDKPLYSWSRDPDYNDWILRDDRGRPVDYREFIPARPNYKNRRHNHTYRDGPIQHGWAGNHGPRHRCGKIHPGRKQNGGRGVLARAEAHRREFLEEFYGRRIRRHFYCD